jgi:hypothetical protein
MISQVQQVAFYGSDIAAVEPEMPVSFLSNGVAYVGQSIPVEWQLGMEDAGYQEQFDFTLSVRLGQFVIAGVDVPQPEATIVIAGVTYRIVKATTDQAGVAVQWQMKVQN